MTKFKMLIGFAAFIALFFMSCVKDEVLGGGGNITPNGGGKFSFSASAAWNDEAITKGVSKSDGTLFPHADFAVFGAMTGTNPYNTTNEAIDTHNFNWMYNAQISGSGSKWSYKPNLGDYYFDFWKNDALHSFVAIAPYSAVNPSDGSTPFTPTIQSSTESSTLDFAVPITSIKDGIDLMYATALNLEGAEYLTSNTYQGKEWSSSLGASATGVVNLKFNHALSQVKFNVKLSESAKGLITGDEEVWIHSIGFRNVYTSGIMNIADNGDAAWKPTGLPTTTIQWHDEDVLTMKSHRWRGPLAPADTTLKSVHVDSLISPIPYIEDTKSYIATMLPQDFTENDNAALVIQYHQKSLSKERIVDSDHPSTLEIVVPIKELQIINDINNRALDNEFLMGHSYTFNITLDMKSGKVLVIVVASAYDWTPIDVNGTVKYSYFNLVDNKRFYNVGSSKYKDGVYTYAKQAVPYKTNLRPSDLQDGTLQIRFTGSTGDRGIWYDSMTDERGNKVEFDVNKHACKIDFVNDTLTYYAPVVPDNVFDSRNSDVMTAKVGNTSIDVEFFYGYIRPIGKMFGDEFDVPNFNYGTGIDDDYMQIVKDKDGNLPDVQYIPVSSSFSEGSITDIASLKEHGGIAEFISRSQFESETDGNEYYNGYPIGDIYFKYRRPTSPEFKGSTDIVKFSANNEMHNIVLTWGFANPNFGFSNLRTDTIPNYYELTWPLIGRLKNVYIAHAKDLISKKYPTLTEEQVEGKAQEEFKKTAYSDSEGNSIWQGLTMEIELETNLSIDELIISQDDPLAGRVEMKMVEKNGDKARHAVVTYTRTGIERRDDIVTLNAGFITYKLAIKFPYLKILDNYRTWDVRPNQSQIINFEYGGVVGTAVENNDKSANLHNDFVSKVQSASYGLSSLGGDRLWSSEGVDVTDSVTKIDYNVLTLMKGGNTYTQDGYIVIGRTTEHPFSKTNCALTVHPGSNNQFSITYYNKITNGMFQRDTDNISLKVGHVSLLIPITIFGPGS